MVNESVALVCGLVTAPKSAPGVVGDDSSSGTSSGPKPSPEVYMTMSLVDLLSGEIVSVAKSQQPVDFSRSCHD